MKVVHLISGGDIGGAWAARSRSVGTFPRTGSRPAGIIPAAGAGARPAGIFPIIRARTGPSQGAGASLKTAECMLMCRKTEKLKDRLIWQQADRYKSLPAACYIESNSTHPARNSFMICHTAIPFSSYSRTSLNFSCQLLTSSNHTSCWTPYCQ